MIADPLQNLPGYSLRRASARWIADYSQRLAVLALTVTEASVLMVIEANPGTSLIAIGRILDIKRANMTPLVTRLESRGFINRAQAGGRAHGLTLSSCGLDLQRQVRTTIDTHEAALIGKVPEQYRDAMLPILQALWRG